MKKIKLNNGVEVPLVGFGTSQITEPLEVEKAVINAIKSGYRHIDTAQSYMNEEAVGKGISKSPPRCCSCWSPCWHGSSCRRHEQD